MFVGKNEPGSGFAAIVSLNPVNRSSPDPETAMLLECLSLKKVLAKDEEKAAQNVLRQCRGVSIFLREASRAWRNVRKRYAQLWGTALQNFFQEAPLRRSRILFVSDDGPSC